jgi:pimeloyl-ACP methyl ester carboxylesterase
MWNTSSTSMSDARLRTADGVAIDAHHDPARSELAVVVAHGFTGSWRRPAVRRVATHLGAAAGVISFDFRGHGRSGGRSTVGDREILDVAAAVAWARELGYARVATVGFSMGSTVVVRHAALHGGLHAVVAVSGPSRWRYRGTVPMRRVHWVIERRLGRLVGRLALRTRVSADGWPVEPEQPVDVAGRIAPTPLLVVHGDRDHYVPVEHAEKLYAAARPPKQLWLEPGFGHAENAAPGELLDRIAAWLTDPPAATPSPPAATPSPPAVAAEP